MDPNSPEFIGKCNPEYFCINSDVMWERDEDSSISLINFMLKFDMVCAGSFTISMFGMMLFTGFTLSSLVLPALSDKIGRRSIFLGCLLVNLIVLAILLIIPDQKEWVNFVIFLFFITGLSLAGRASVGYCFMLECAPERYSSIMGSFWNISEGMVYIYATVYYRWVSKDWWWTIAFALVLQTVTLFLLYRYSTESPKWLYNKKKFAECQYTMRYMADWNGVELNPNSCLNVPMFNKQEKISESTIKTDESQWGIIKNYPGVLRNLLCMVMVWVSASFCYYLISYQLKYIKGDIFTNGIVSSISECIAYGVSGILYTKMGIKNVLILSYALTIGGMYLLITVPTNA